MTQMQFEIIVKIIENGASALADELITSLDNIVKERNSFYHKIKQYESEKDEDAGEQK